MENYIIKSGKFDSSNGKNEIAYYTITPRKNPIAVVQFCHGMAEHSKRYEDFGKFLAEQGIVFCICDHLGHGESISSKEDLGYFAPHDGWKNLVKDASRLTKLMKKKHHDIPYFIAGHSMGSFVTRAYISMYKDYADGAVIIGTGNATPLIKMGAAVAKAIGLFKGERYRSKLMDKLSFGGYNKQVGQVRTPSDWLSRDNASVDKYIADPLCGFIFTTSGYKDVSNMMCHVSTKKWAESIKKDMPIFLVAGDADPVGDYGKGVRKLSEMLKESGVSDVTLKLYDQARHEILNETNASEVYSDISAWLLAKISTR